MTPPPELEARIVANSSALLNGSVTTRSNAARHPIRAAGYRPALGTFWREAVLNGEPRSRMAAWMWRSALGAAAGARQGTVLAVADLYFAGKDGGHRSWPWRADALCSPHASTSPRGNRWRAGKRSVPAASVGASPVLTCTGW